MKKRKKVDVNEAMSIGQYAVKEMLDSIEAQMSQNKGQFLGTAFLSSFQTLAEIMIKFYEKDVLLDILDDSEEVIPIPNGVPADVINKLH